MGHFGVKMQMRSGYSIQTYFSAMLCTSMELSKKMEA